MNTKTCTKKYKMTVNSTQYQVQVWIYLFLCPLDLILWFLSSWVKLWATSLWTTKLGAGNLNISLPVYHHCFVCLVGILWLANIVEQYGSTWDELASPFSRLVNGPISIQLFQEDGIIFWNENRKQSFANENVTLRVTNVFVQSSQHVQCNSIV